MMPAKVRNNRGRSGRPWRQVRLFVLARDNGVCWICRRDGATTVDHVIPLARGGEPLDPSNLRAAHHSCNSRRKDALPPKLDRRY